MPGKLENLSIVVHKKDDLRLEVTELPGEPGPNGMKLRNESIYKYLNIL